MTTLMINYLHTVNLKKRNICEICNSDRTTDLFCLNDMPVYMGVNTGFEEFFHPMTFQKCDNCGNLQISEIINPELIYKDNHNKEIVGQLWKDHYTDFISFIKPHVIGKNILEIGDPSFKLSNELSRVVKKWIVVEKNINVNIDFPKNTEVIESFFDEDFKLKLDIDVVVHSHFLEHVTNPIGHLKLIYDLLPFGGMLLFSVPNLGKLFEISEIPVNILHFEHTFFFTKDYLTSVLKNCGFKVISTSLYKNHSIFFLCEKTFYETNKIKLTHDKNYSEILLSKHINSLERIKLINETIKYHDNVFLYGSHISTQYMINIGLNLTNITCILDNSKSKWGYNLYGTTLMVKPITEISNLESAIIIISHMGVYANEIKNQLENLNKKIKFI
jgi:predicted SAM-dependent methyltransferase